MTLNNAFALLAFVLGLSLGLPSLGSVSEYIPPVDGGPVNDGNDCN